MRTAVYLLAEILKSALRIEHKIDILIRHAKTGEGHPLRYTPSMSVEQTDPVVGEKIKYKKVDLTNYGEAVFVREDKVRPTTLEIEFLERD